MCGILGILSLELSLPELQRINDLMAHRGPDDSGVYIGDGVGLAARRLSIIDLNAKSQPVSSEDGRIRLVCNGEVYNASDLRAELEAAGHVFATRTDIETIVHGYEEWGDQIISRLRGMFALALWDSGRRRLVLARDRFGIKPLYYAQTKGKFACASEIRPILELLPDVPRRANMQALWRLFEVGYIPFQLTAFENVFRLPPAHMLIVENGEYSLQEYWRLEFPEMGKHSSVEVQSVAAEFVERLREAVDAWRMSDVPVGSLLSGGVDSSSLAALLTEISGGPIHTFNVGFSYSSLNESHLARKFSQSIRSQHHEVDFSLASFDYHADVVRALEEPECSLTSTPLYLIYKSCHDAGFKVIMTGEGADELLGGYSWYQGDRRLQPYLRYPQWIRTLFKSPLMAGHNSLRDVFAEGTPDPIQRFLLWQRVAGKKQIEALLDVEAPTSCLDLYRDMLGNRCNGLHPFDQFLLIESQTRLVNYINLKLDHLGMIHSVEVRPPFLDHLLWEFVARLPPEVKLSRHADKYLLRLGMQGRLPDAIRNRPKRGLTAPVTGWWRAKQLPEWAEAVLTPHALKESGYFRVEEVQRLRALHQSGRVNVARLLCGVLNTQLWHYEVLNRAQ
jgi:asparagine synthase (glutamine-hydrolysing)